MKRTTLKLAIVAFGATHQQVCTEANKHLAPDEHLTKARITQLVTCRKEPTPDQAAALARVLGRSTVELFPLEVNP